MQRMEKDTLLQSMRDARAAIAAGHVTRMDGRVLADKVEGSHLGHCPEHLPHLA
jgi:hypothetical protein